MTAGYSAPKLLAAEMLHCSTPPTPGALRTNMQHEKRVKCTFFTGENCEPLQSVPQASKHGVHGEQRAVRRRVPHGVSHGTVEHYDGRQRPEAGARDGHSRAANSGHPLRARHTRDDGGSEGQGEGCHAHKHVRPHHNTPHQVLAGPRPDGAQNTRRGLATACALGERGARCTVKNGGKAEQGACTREETRTV